MTRTNIFVISDLIKNKIETFDNGQTIVYYNTMKPWQIGKGFAIDYLILIGYTWNELDPEIQLGLAPMVRQRGAPTFKPKQIIEI